MSIRSSLTHLHGFQLLVWLPYLIGITFFCLYQQNKSSESKVKFRQASNHCKGVLQASKMEYANETKEKFTSQKLGSWHFWWIANSILKKVNLLYLLYSMVLSSASDKAKLFAKNFSRNYNLDDSSLYLFSFLELNWNCQSGYICHNKPWFVKGIWSWLYSIGGSKELWTWTLIHTRWIHLICVWRNLVFQIAGLFLYLKMLWKGVQLKTAALLVVFLWL